MQKKKKPVKTVLIGETVDIIDTKNTFQKGMNGKIIDETRNTIKLMTKKGVKTLIKDQIKIKTEKTKIDGEKLLGRTEERIKG